jgi:hypothetical protein
VVQVDTLLVGLLQRMQSQSELVVQEQTPLQQVQAELPHNMEWSLLVVVAVLELADLAALLLVQQLSQVDQRLQQFLIQALQIPQLALLATQAVVVTC